jgi:hypothetical protein
MPGVEGRVPKKLGRRVLLRNIAKGVTASLLGLAGARKAQQSDKAAALEVCYWKYQYSVCDSGQLLERWCFICCAGIDCEIFVCEWRPGGSC